MPAHIYIRVGRSADAITANQHAVHADEAFIEGQKPQGLYPLAYYPHNHHFLAFAATLAGKSALAIEAAKRTAATTPVGTAKQVRSEEHTSELQSPCNLVCRLLLEKKKKKIKKIVTQTTPLTQSQ